MEADCQQETARQLWVSSSNERNLPPLIVGRRKLLLYLERHGANNVLIAPSWPIQEVQRSKPRHRRRKIAVLAHLHAHDLGSRAKAMQAQDPEWRPGRMVRHGKSRCEARSSEAGASARERRGVSRRVEAPRLCNHENYFARVSSCAGTSCVIQSLHTSNRKRCDQHR